MAALTLKQEAFCQRYIETGNASEAYRLAYNASGMKPATINRKAVELTQNGKVAARVTELKSGLAKAHQVTVASLLAELEEARVVARRQKTASSMVQATMGKAKLVGLDKDPDTGGEEAQPVLVKVEATDARVKRAEA